MIYVLKFTTEIGDTLDKHFGQFRSKSWEETEQSVQSSWFLYCQCMLQAIAKSFGKYDAMANSLVSEVVSLSDEAFALIPIKYQKRQGGIEHCL
jgi:hypothetical protein